MKPITPEERLEWSREAFSITPRPIGTRPVDITERSFQGYVSSLDVAETKLLALECLRRLMRNRTHEHKVSVVAWIAQAARSLMTDNFEKADALAETRSQSSRKGWETR